MTTSPGGRRRRQPPPPPAPEPRRIRGGTQSSGAPAGPPPVAPRPPRSNGYAGRTVSPARPARSASSRLPRWRGHGRSAPSSLALQRSLERLAGREQPGLCRPLGDAEHGGDFGQAAPIEVGEYGDLPGITVEPLEGRLQ